MDSADEDGGLMNEKRLALSGGGGILRRCEGRDGGRVGEDCSNVTLTRRLGQQIGMRLKCFSTAAGLISCFEFAGFYCHFL